MLAAAYAASMLPHSARAQKTPDDYRREAEAYEAEAARLLGETGATSAPVAARARPAAASAPAPPVAGDGLPACRVGMHAPRVSPLNYGAVILAEDRAKGTYRVKSDADGLVDWVSSYSLRTSCAGATAQPVTISFFIGNWEMFVGPTPNHVVIGGKNYLEVGPGAKAPPIVVRADGTYSWRIDSRSTVNGRWRPLAEAETKYRKGSPAILLMKGEDGKDWQMTRRGTALGDNRDQADVERMDLGLSYIATRGR